MYYAYVFSDDHLYLERCPLYAKCGDAETGKRCLKFKDTGRPFPTSCRLKAIPEKIDITRAALWKYEYGKGQNDLIAFLTGDEDDKGREGQSQKIGKDDF